MPTHSESADPSTFSEKRNVTLVSGTVLEVTHPAYLNGTTSVLSVGSRLTEGDFIVTGEGGRASLRFNDGSRANIGSGIRWQFQPDIMERCAGSPKEFVVSSRADCPTPSAVTGIAG